MDFKNKFILAPMVRVGFLPMRLLCLDYGCDIVYCEEIIDHKMLQCKRIVNPVLNTVDFVAPGETYPIFQTCPLEKGKVVFQMGTCDAQRALKVAKLVENDVAAIDINMGCPKSFSIQGGMGAALLTQPEKIRDILTTLVNGVSIPITCKIRILPQLDQTIQLAKLIESCGVAALAVHGRSKNERPQHENRNDVIKCIASAVSIPVIANGGSKDLSSYENLHKFRDDTCTSSVMVARSAMLNPSIFRKNGLLDINVVAANYLKFACDFDSNPPMVKYTLQLFLQDALHNTERGKKLLESSNASIREFCCLWDLEEYYSKQLSKRRDRQMRFEQNLHKFENRPIYKDALCLKIPFVRKHFDRIVPKIILNDYCKLIGIEIPVFVTECIEKKFVSVVEVDGKRFYSSFREKNKKLAEQAAAFVAVLGLNLHNRLPSAAFDDVPLDEVKLKLSTTLLPHNFNDDKV